MKYKNKEFKKNTFYLFKNVRNILLGFFLAFSFLACHRKPYAFVQISKPEVLIQKSKPKMETLSKILPLSVGILPDTSLKVNQLQANVSPILLPDLQTKLRQKIVQIQLLKHDPKPKFLQKFKKKLKNWHPFRRKHRITRRLIIGVVLLGIAICMEFFLHLQILTLLFGIVALLYLIGGLKRLV